MYLPTTYGGALLLTILSMICWGSWANTQKLSGKWRFELFYFDYSFGVLLLAVVAAFTFGSMNSQELTVFDTFALVAKRKMAWAVAGGVVFNLANMLLVAAISLSGLSVAFPIGIGLALVIGVVWNYALNPQGNPVLLFSGAALVVAAIIVDAIAYSVHARLKAGGPAKQRAAKPGSPATVKGIVISLISGVLMGSFYPLVEMARAGDDGVRTYGDALLFAAGVFCSTFVFNLFFMMMPVQGEPVSMGDYFRGTGKQHLLGVAGGMIWCIGAVSNFVASSAPQSVQVGPAVSYAMGQGATMVSAFWGLLVWKEFAGAEARVTVLLTLMILLFLTGLALVSLAPLYAR
jgi:glucose uptake protein